MTRMKALLWLPFPNFALSVHVLTDAALERAIRSARMLQTVMQGVAQFVEVEKPLLDRWDGCVTAVMLYGDLGIREWARRGKMPLSHNLMFTRTVEDDLPSALETDVTMPTWLGDEAYHAGHRERLMKLEPGHYAPWFETKKETSA